MAGRSRWLKWALVASLCLNVAVLGVIGGALMKGPPPGPMPGFALWSYARALPDPYKRALGKALRENRRNWIGPREAQRAQRAAFAAALTADPFDPATALAVLTQEAHLNDELAARGTRLLLTQIERMSPEERAAYAAALEERRGRHWKR